MTTLEKQIVEETVVPEREKVEEVKDKEVANDNQVYIPPLLINHLFHIHKGLNEPKKTSNTRNL